MIYLNAALEESLGDKESQEVLLNALRNVAEAQGGLGELVSNCVNPSRSLCQIFV